MMLVAVIAALVVCGTAAEQGADQKLIYVTVADQNSKPVAGLTAADIAVREDGVVREVATVTAATDPGFFILTVDTSTGSSSARDIERNVSDLRNGASAFMRQVLTAQPQAQVSLWEHAGAAIQIRNFTSKIEDLEKDAKRLAYKADPSVLLEAYSDGARELQRKQTTRRVLVSFTFDSSPEGSTMPAGDVLTNVRRSGAQVWGVTLRDRPPASPNRDNVINAATKLTGGARLTINTVAAIEPTMKQIADLILNQYAVTYSRPSGGKGPDKLEVMVKRENVLVAAPQGAPR
jgi:hypothetical protein